MEKERKRRGEEEEGRREEEENQGLELMFGILVWNFLFMFGTLVWNLFIWICWLGNPPSSLFAYVWDLKNPISV